MERLTGRKEDGHAYVIGCPEFEVPKEANTVLQSVADKCADLEDILGDTYDLDRVRELIAADRAGRCVPVTKDLLIDANAESLMLENAALKSQIVNITAEKNAAINDLLQVGRGYDFCTVCAHCCEGGKPKYRPQEPYMEFCKKCNDDYSQFEWRDSWDGKNGE